MRILAGVFALVLALPAAASTFLEVTPSVVELSVAPGQETKGEMSVRNPGDTETLVEIDFRDSWAERTGQPGLDPKLWLTLDFPKPFVLKPGQSKRVKYAVNPPADFTGEAMAMVGFSGPTRSEPNQPANVQFRLGVPIYIITQGSDKPALSIKTFGASGKAEGPMEFFIEVKNDGNVHLRPAGRVDVTDKTGKKVFEAEFAFGMPVFPGQTQRYFAKGPAKTPRGNFIAKAVMLKSAKGEPLAEGQLGFAVKKTGVTIVLPFSEKGLAP